jgi:hypothetical protein
VNGTAAPARWVSTGTIGRRVATVPKPRRAGSIVTTLVLAAGAAVIAAIIANNTMLAVTVTPILAVAALFGLWVLPLRIPLYVCAFLLLGIDAREEGLIDSPFAAIGHLFAHNLNQIVPIAALALPLMGFVLFYLLIIQSYRKLAGSQIDGLGSAHVATRMTMNAALGFSFLVVLFECANGYASGGDLQMAKNQIQFFILTLLTAYLFGGSLRGIADYRTLGTVVVASACSKALITLWVYYTYYSTTHMRPAVATAHGDSILFASAAIILVARFLEHSVRRHGMVLMALLPLLAGAMVANNRRLVWVELAAGLAVVQFLGRRTRIRRVLLQAAVPLLLVYVAIGWNSGASIFAPIRSLRSMNNAELDSSTLFREIENFNLLMTMRMSPIVGLGFGRPFASPAANFSIEFFKEYPYLPHNSILGLWAFTGWLGFTGLFTAVVTGVFWAAHRYRRTNIPDERAAALAAISVILIYLIQCWGDIGFSEKEAIFLVGPALGIAGQLSVQAGHFTMPVRTAVRRHV